MAQKYRHGHRFEVWLSDQAWADLALLDGPTKRARIEAALALAVEGGMPAPVEDDGVIARRHIDVANADELQKLGRRIQRRLGG